MQKCSLWSEHRKREHGHLEFGKYLKRSTTDDGLLLFLLIIFCILVTPSWARPHNTTMVEFVDGSRERTRILSFPRLPSPTSNAHREDEDDDQQDIVFPDALEDGAGDGGSHHHPLIVARIDKPPECATGSGTTFCETIPSYPYKLLRDVLSARRSGSLHLAAAHAVLFGMDETPDEIAQRIGEPEENYICGAVDKTVYPKVGKTKNNKWKYIINQGTRDGYVQGVRVETCVSSGRPCDLFGTQPNGFITACKQKFIYRKMLSLSEGGQPMPDTFLMPSACCCSYKRDTQFLARFGDAPVTPVR